jgi:hypothetical protein
LLNAFDAYTAIDIATLLHAVTFDKAFDENDAVLLAKDDIVVNVVIAVERLDMLAYRFDVKLLTPAILRLIAFKALCISVRIFIPFHLFKFFKIFLIHQGMSNDLVFAISQWNIELSTREGSSGLGPRHRGYPPALSPCGEVPGALLG